MSKRSGQSGKVASADLPSRARLPCTTIHQISHSHYPGKQPRCSRISSHPSPNTVPPEVPRFVGLVPGSSLWPERSSSCASLGYALGGRCVSLAPASGFPLPKLGRPSAGAGCWHWPPGREMENSTWRRSMRHCSAGRRGPTVEKACSQMRRAAIHCNHERLRGPD